MKNQYLVLLACLIVSGAALGQEPMPLQVMPNSPAGRAFYNPAANWQTAPPVPASAPMMAYPPIYPAVWQFGPNPNAGVVPAFQNDNLPDPGLVVGPPLQKVMTLPPKNPIVQTNAQAVSCAPSPAAACVDSICGPPPCGPSEPYLVDTNPWQPARCNRYYVMGDYLLWWTKKQTVPDETAEGFPAFTLPNNGPRNGARLTMGAWLNPSKTLALEASGFWLEDRTTNASVNQGPNAIVTSLPFLQGIDAQTSALHTSSQLWGAEIDVRYKGWERSGSVCRGYVDFLAGFRYLNLSEGLTFTNSTLFTVNPVELGGALVNTSDFVGTHNNFYAPQVGFETGMSIGRFDVSLYSKIALGINDESVHQLGQGIITAPPLPLGNVVTPGGLLVQAPGRFNQEVFSYMPEAGLNFGFKLSEWCQIGAGYSFLYLGNVVRPGDHVPAGTGAIFPQSLLPLVGLPGVAQPPFTFSQSSFWAQGANVRVTFIF